jgi:hypothetical protein
VLHHRHFVGETPKLGNEFIGRHREASNSLGR